MVRAVGPGLAQWINGLLSDPRLTLFHDGAEREQNDNGSGSDGREIGAFALPAGSPDSVISSSLAPGLYTVHAEGTTSTDAGVVLVELYVVP